MSRDRTALVSTAAIVVALCRPGTAAAADDFPLSAYWPLNEGKGQVVRDWSGTATTASSARRRASTPTTRHGSRASSAGAPRCASTVATRHDPRLRRLEPQQMTVSAWFRGSRTPGNNRYLVAKGSNLCQSASYGLVLGPERRHGVLRLPASRPTAGRARPRRRRASGTARRHDAAGTWDGSDLRASSSTARRSTTARRRHRPARYGTPSGNTTLGAYVGTCDLAPDGRPRRGIDLVEGAPGGRHRPRAAVLLAPH